jgi:hypothetical protein
VNGCSSAANAVAEVKMAAALAPVAVCKRDRRVIMANLVSALDRGWMKAG